MQNPFRSDYVPRQVTQAGPATQPAQNATETAATDQGETDAVEGDAPKA